MLCLNRAFEKLRGAQMTFAGGEWRLGTYAWLCCVPDAALPSNGPADLCWSSLSKLNSYVPLCQYY